MKTKILVVEDMDIMRNALKSLFDKRGYEVFEASNGEDALVIADYNNPDLAIVDLILPVMDGFQFIESLKKNEKFKNIPIIILTAKDSKEDVVKGISLGVQEYIVKPFNTNDLLDKVKKLLK